LRVRQAKIHSEATNPREKWGHREGQSWGQAIILS
jgi:hypothetical protein